MNCPMPSGSPSVLCCLGRSEGGSGSMTGRSSMGSSGSFGRARPGGTCRSGTARGPRCTPAFADGRWAPSSACSGPPRRTPTRLGTSTGRCRPTPPSSHRRGREPNQLLPTLVAGGVLASGGETSSATEDGSDRVHGPWGTRPRTRPRFLHHPCLGCRWRLFTRLGPQRPCAVQHPRGVLQRHQRVRNPPIAHGNGELLRVLAPADAEDGAS